MATPAAHTAALMELNQTMVNLTPTFNQLVVTLTPQPEARNNPSLSHPAQQPQRRLGRFSADWDTTLTTTTRGRTAAATTCKTFLCLNGQPSGQKMMQLPKPASICRCTLPQRSAPSSQCSAFPGWGRSGIFQMFTCTSEGAKQTTSSSGQGKVGIAG